MYKLLTKQFLIYNRHHIATKLRWALTAFIFLTTAGSTPAQDVASTHLVEQAPVAITKIAPGLFLVDFGRVAFGNLSLTPPNATTSATIIVRFGEALKAGRVDTHPPGSVRYSEVSVSQNGAIPLIVAPPSDPRNTTPPAVLTPPDWGVLTPFRWVEVEGWPTELAPSQIRRRAAFDTTWVDYKGTFRSSDPMLDKVWDLCHYSIKATTFAGIFVDGDRERKAYEADAYITQLGYYAGDADPQMPRATFDRLIQYPTWPSEWAPHMIFMAFADWMQNGDRAWLAAHYAVLKSKLLESRVGPEGLVVSSIDDINHNDIVDWPPGERDGFIFTSTNTVVNAFHLKALDDMACLADALGKKQDARNFSHEEKTALSAFQKKLFNPATGLYRDGLGTQHSSLHANLFPLAFGLVPPGERTFIARWLAGRGMAGSVYAAQYLLQSLFENDQDTVALNEITALGDRSWRHMVESGATITWEAWDQKYKPNLDWNHAWGAAPANLLPRYILGAQPLAPGWTRALIQPHTGTLTSAAGQIPTPQGGLSVSWNNSPNFTLILVLPRKVTAAVEVPVQQGAREVWVNGSKAKTHRVGNWWILDKDVSGTVRIEDR